MINHLKGFGNIDDKIYAKYIESLLPEIETMKVWEVKEIYLQVREAVHNLRAKYFTAVVVPIFEDLVVPVVTYALTEATFGTAAILINRIPLKFVLRGVRLNKIVKGFSKLGIPGLQGNHIREIHGSTVSKADELFNSVTRDAISKTTNSQSTVVANMGMIVI